MENIFKDEAIVLRRSCVGEYDFSVTVYFRKHGKENIYIPKGQIVRSPFITSTEQFNWFKGVFLYRKDNVYVKEIDDFRNLSLKIASSIDIFETAFYFSNLFNRYVIFPDERLFIFLKKSFYYLTKAKKVKNHRINFISKLIFLSGIFPQLYNCSICGEEINKKNFKGISLKNGGSVCVNCSSTDINPYINYYDIKFIDIFSKISFDKIESISIKKPDRIELFLNEYIKEKA